MKPTAAAAFGLTCLMLAGQAASAQTATPGTTVISTLNYQVEVALANNNLSCVFTPGHHGTYIPYDTAYAQLAQDDYRPVMEHKTVGTTVRADERNGLREIPQDLCAKVERIRTDAAATNNTITVAKTVELSIIDIRNGYNDRCDRQLREVVTVKLPQDLVLTSEQYRFLSSVPLSECK